jgi:hypothetical protein
MFYGKIENHNKFKLKGMKKQKRKVDKVKGMEKKKQQQKFYKEKEEERERGKKR